MFEKEAEEIAERKIGNFIPQQWGVSLIRTEPTWETVEGAPHFYLNSLAKMWQDGAEFGYNKAKVEVEESYKESLCNSELNLASVTEQLEELEKANEWHYVSEKGLPKESGRYLVYVGGGEKGVYSLDFETEYNDFGYWCLIVNSASLGVTDTIFETITERNEDKVIAWKEIELPELPKEIRIWKQ